MGTLEYRCLSLDGPPGCCKETVFSQLKGLLFKKGWLGLPLMTDIGELWTSRCYEQDPRVKMAASRIQHCPKERMLLLDFVGFAEARKPSALQVFNYGLGAMSPKILKVVILPDKEVAYKTMTDDCRKNRVTRIPWAHYSFLYDGYTNYVTKNSRRVFVVEQRFRPAAAASKKILDALKKGAKNVK